MQLLDSLIQSIPFVHSLSFSVLFGFVSFLIAYIVTYFVAKLAELTSKKSLKTILTFWDDSRYLLPLRRPLQFILLSWIVMSIILLYPPYASFEVFFQLVAKLVTYASVIRIAWIFTGIFEQFLIDRANRTSSKLDDLLAPLIIRSIKTFVVIIGSLSFAEVLSLPLTSLLTGLGIGGIAIAMAAKDTIANVFGSLTVIVDRPFQIGDWVKINNEEGTVEYLGFRSTRIRTFYNSLVTIPNSVLLTSNIDNMGARTFRRLNIKVGITYQTSADKIEAFCEGIREIIRQHPNTRKDYFNVYLNQFSASSLDILVYCFFEVPDWTIELQARHEFLLDIKRLAQHLSIDFAYPTQSIFVEKDPTIDDEAPIKPLKENAKKIAQNLVKSTLKNQSK